MKRSTVFLKITIIFIAVVVLAVSFIGIIFLARNRVATQYSGVLYPLILGLYVSSVPFYMALFKAFKLLCYISKNTAFSQDSVNALKNIKHCAVSISIIYLIMIPFVYLLADKDDAPGLIFIGIVPIFASAVIAVFAAVLQSLLQDAIDIKSENDLTV